MLHGKMQQGADLSVLFRQTALIGKHIQLSVFFAVLHFQRKLHVGIHLVQLVHEIDVFT